ncbi:MAG: ribbon-helix-helix domain-containing protein [Deltaproteobacteria bacterium]|nr:ribbon-helix-helix domain-containing protein [Deltaproteobacteria bacterium]
MAKKQTRRSISVSRNTYERLKAYCETTGVSMSSFVEERVGDFLGRSERPVRKPANEAESNDPDVKLTPDQIFTF